MIATILLFAAISLQEEVDFGLLLSVCKVESSLRKTALVVNDGNGRTSIGICQVQHRTARFMGYKGGPKQLLDPETNITYAAKYLKYQLKRYGSKEKAVEAYNRGHAKKRAKKTPIYVTRVMRLYKELE